VCVITCILTNLLVYLEKNYKQFDAIFINLKRIIIFIQMIKRLFVNEAYNQAMKSDMNFNHGALIIYRGKIVGKGFNTYINSNYNCKQKISLHAEVSAINDALKKMHVNDLKNCELIIIRVNNAGLFVNSKPCCNCQKFINQFPIRRVYYSS
jgi:tRNA(Arg) A34 adenosine deaminase TadA